MGNILTRLREAVATSDSPQLKRGGKKNEPLEESVSQAERDKAVKNDDAFPDGSFPITTQKQADDAWDLRGHDENHSTTSIVAHIRAQVKKHGLKMPGSSGTRESVSLQVLLREARVTKKGNAYEVTIVREGPGNPGDRNYYTKQALREAVKSGLFEGLQAYLNHPTPDEERDRPERDVRYLAGHFREAHYVDGNPAEVRAKFIPGGMDKNGVVALVESALDGMPLGISIDGYGHAPDQQDIGGETYNMVREVTQLGSADIVTRAGAGGKFHRRLQEAWRTTNPAERAGGTSKEARMKPAKLQEKVKDAVAALERAAGLKDEESEQADELVSGAIASLRECATVELKGKTVVEIREVEKPVAATDTDADKLAAENAALEQKLRETEADRDKERKGRKDAETERDTLRSSITAHKVLRESGLPEKARENLFEDLIACEDEDGMKRLVEGRKAEREELLSELRESAPVEGAGARIPLPASGGGNSSGGLLDRMGIDRDELAA